MGLFLSNSRQGLFSPSGNGREQQETTLRETMYNVVIPTVSDDHAETQEEKARQLRAEGRRDVMDSEQGVGKDGIK
jgi:hypothetical protein